MFKDCRCLFFIEFKHTIVCLTNNSKLFLQKMYKYACYCSVKTATMSMTSFYWPRSIKPSQQWLIIQGSTLTCLATNNCLTSFCFYLTCQLHIIFLKQSAVIFVCVLKKKAIDDWRNLNKVQDIVLKKYLSEKYILTLIVCTLKILCISSV